MIRLKQFVFFSIHSIAIAIFSFPLSAQSTFPILVRDINPNGSSTPKNFFVYNDKLIFFARNGAGNGLWITDGTPSGTKFVKGLTMDLNEAFEYGHYFTILNNKVYFFADDGVHGIELWVTDGSEAGTYLVKDIAPGKSGQEIFNRNIMNMNGVLIFSADDAIHGEQIWRSDGTAEGTNILSELGGLSARMDTLNKYLYFAIYTAYKPAKIYRTNGTTEGTTLFYTDNSQMGIIHSLYYHNHFLYFVTSGQSGYQIWSTDGTEKGTVMIKALQYYTSHTHTHKFISGGTQLYFAGNDGSGEALWKTDGTVAGTIMVKRMNKVSPMIESHQSNTPAVYCNGSFYFAFYNRDLKVTQLYKTNGSPEGTAFVSDMIGGFEDPVVVGNTIYFRGSDKVHKDELWISDGTKEGTHMLVDGNNLLKQSGLTYHDSYIEFKGALYLSYNDGLCGVELFKIAKKK